MTDDRVPRIARLLQRIGEAYYAQGQSRVREMEHQWSVVNPGPTGDGPPPLNLWVAAKLLESGFTPPDATTLDALVAQFAVAAGDRSRKGK